MSSTYTHMTWTKKKCILSCIYVYTYVLLCVCVCVYIYIYAHRHIQKHPYQHTLQLLVIKPGLQGHEVPPWPTNIRHRGRWQQPSNRRRRAGVWEIFLGVFTFFYFFLMCVPAEQPPPTRLSLQRVLRYFWFFFLVFTMERPRASDVCVWTERFVCVCACYWTWTGFVCVFTSELELRLCVCLVLNLIWEETLNSVVKERGTEFVKGERSV